MALTFGTYVHPDLARPLGVAAVVALTVVNYRGVEKTARLTRVIVAVVLAAAAFGGQASVANLDAGAPNGVWGVLQSGGLLFLAFAGCARLATLDEEVRDPEVTIPKVIPLALGIVVGIYAVVLVTALLAVGADTLAAAPDPLVAAVAAGRWAAATPLVRFGAAVASAGVLLSLLTGLSRTTLSMARRRELPGFLDAVHAEHHTPYRAEVAASILVSGIVVVANLRGAIGFSSFAVLTYYGLANASGFTLAGVERRWPRWPRWLAGLGVALCAVLALALPRVAVVGGLVLHATGSLVWLITRRAAGRGGT